MTSRFAERYPSSPANTSSDVMPTKPRGGCASAGAAKHSAADTAVMKARARTRLRVGNPGHYRPGSAKALEVPRELVEGGLGLAVDVKQPGVEAPQVLEVGRVR